MNGDNDERHSSKICASNTPVSSVASRRQMSSSLRERLKRSSRYYTSPLTPTGTSSDASLRKTVGTKLNWPIVCQTEHSEQNNEHLFSSNSGLLFDKNADAAEMKSSESESCLTKRFILVQNEEKTLLSDRTKRAKLSEISLSLNKDSESEESNEINSVSSTGVSQKSLLLTSREQVPGLDTDSITQSVKQLEQEKCLLLERISKKKETLRKLNMVKIYRAKNDLIELQQLTSKWYQVCQVALQDLFQLLPEPRPSMTELLHHFQIDFSKVGYSPDDDSFT